MWQKEETHTISIGGWCRHMHHARGIRHNFCLTNSHSSYLHPSLTICDSPSHQIFTVGPIKHSLRSTATFICPPPSSLQLVHQKPPPKAWKHAHALPTCWATWRPGASEEKRSRWWMEQNCPKKETWTKKVSKVEMREEQRMKKWSKREESEVHSSTHVQWERRSLNNSTVGRAPRRSSSCAFADITRPYLIPG